MVLGRFSWLFLLIVPPFCSFWLFLLNFFLNFLMLNSRRCKTYLTGTQMDACKDARTYQWGQWHVGRRTQKGSEAIQGIWWLIFGTLCPVALLLLLHHRILRGGRRPCHADSTVFCIMNKSKGCSNGTALWFIVYLHLIWFYEQHWKQNRKRPICVTLPYEQLLSEFTIDK